MDHFYLLDVSFGVWDIFLMLLSNPIVLAVFVALGGFLIYLGVKATRREITKKNGGAAASSEESGTQQPAVSEASDEEQPAETAQEENEEPKAAEGAPQEKAGEDA